MGKKKGKPKKEKWKSLWHANYYSHQAHTHKKIIPNTQGSHLCWTHNHNTLLGQKHNKNTHTHEGKKNTKQMNREKKQQKIRHSVSICLDRAIWFIWRGGENMSSFFFFLYNLIVTMGEEWCPSFQPVILILFKKKQKN